MRAAHVIKGAAANLMCGQLRQASFQLEQAAARAHEAQGREAELRPAVLGYFAEMQRAGQNYVAFLQSIGV